MAKTSRPASSVFCAICTIASIRSASAGVCPDTGSRVMSLTEKIPNCMAPPGKDVCVCMYLNLSWGRRIPGGTARVPGGPARETNRAGG
jgi:hypothetical protein